jgi:hypothetical protein
MNLRHRNKTLLKATRNHEKFHSQRQMLRVRRSDRQILPSASGTTRIRNQQAIVEERNGHHALVREAEFGESRADFTHKLSIALKEANETLYWLSLLDEAYDANDKASSDLYNECNELVSILVAIVKKSRAPAVNS